MDAQPGQTDPPSPKPAAELLTPVAGCTMDAQPGQTDLPLRKRMASDPGRSRPGQTVPVYGRERRLTRTFSSAFFCGRLPEKKSSRLMASVKRGRNSMQKANPFCTTVPLDRQTTATLTPSSDGSDQVDASADEMKRSLKDGVSSMALEMLTGEKQAVPAGILLPTQPFVLWWEGVSALLLVYTALVLPVRLANFALIEDDSVGWNWSDPWTFLGSPALEYRTPPLCVSQHVGRRPEPPRRTAPSYRGRSPRRHLLPARHPA